MTNLGPMTDWRGGSTASSGTSGTNRVSAMKAAFQSQFKSSFVSAFNQEDLSFHEFFYLGCSNRHQP